MAKRDPYREAYSRFPVIDGGQGREDEELERYVGRIGWVLLAFVVAALACVVWGVFA